MRVYYLPSYDKELMKYMGEEFVAKKFDSELDAYLKSGGGEQ